VRSRRAYCSCNCLSIYDGHVSLLRAGVREAFRDCGLDETHLTFVKELILGGPDEAPAYVPW
jgi:hypothetical protein